MRNRLQAFISQHHHQLTATLRLYIIRSGLADSDSAEQLALDLLSDVTVEALDHAERFDSARHPMSWLLGIGANLIKQRLDARYKREKREPLVRDLYAAHADVMSDGELFDLLATYVEDGRSLDDDLIVTEMLNQLTPDERQIIRLAVIHDLNGDALAEALSIKPGAARMRLHRALRRLRALYHQEAL